MNQGIWFGFTTTTSRCCRSSCGRRCQTSKSAGECFQMRSLMHIVHARSVFRVPNSCLNLFGSITNPTSMCCCCCCFRYLHTPFPSSEVYRILPVRKQLLQGLLAADLIGFQTYDYARHFLSVCTRVLGLVVSPSTVQYRGRQTTVGVFPIGIEPKLFTEYV